MGISEILLAIIGFIVVIALVLFFAFLFGHSFRQFNHGDLNYDSREENKGTSWLTFVIGFIILILLFSIFKGC